MSIWFTLRREKLRKIIRIVTARRQVSIITYCSLSETPRPVKYKIYGTAFTYYLHQRVVYNRHLVKKPLTERHLNCLGIFHFSLFNYRRHAFIEIGQVGKIFGKSKPSYSISCLRRKTFAVKEDINFKTQFIYKKIGTVKYRSINDGRSVAFPSFE